MTPLDLDLLRSQVDSPVRIVCRDGEVLIAKVLFVSESERDVTYGLISSNRISRYEKFDRQPAYLIPFEEIDSVEPYQDA